MNKYILMLGVAAVSIGSYCAMASNSATMQVSATIAHDVSLTVTHAFEGGTITIDPSQSYGIFTIDSDGSVRTSQGVTSVTGASRGTFTANVPDSCKESDQFDDGSHPCFSTNDQISFGGFRFEEPYIYYVSGNNFQVGFNNMFYDDTVPTPGDYSQNITITYTAP
ncbi:MAG: hypothetical protein IJ689_00180 [Alphaproteobacteria bacterium]|nr:hypothetical protein [Alphaproteobacteria bacterium]